MARRTSNTTPFLGIAEHSLIDGGPVGRGYCLRVHFAEIIEYSLNDM
jgi:hypothetical protein